MTRPRLLDLFCGGGGCSVGYRRAGFEVIGVDIDPQPRYPYEFVRADALSVLRGMTDYPTFSGEMWRPGYFAAVHASPPCQDHSMCQNMTGRKHGTGWMLAAVRERLQACGAPWVIENVPGAPMRADYVLCGCMVGLPKIRRERWFETSWGGFSLRPPCSHTEPAMPIIGRGVTSYYRRRYGSQPIDVRRAAMGIDWKMNREELAQAIPPAYTEYIGGQLLDHLTAGTGRETAEVNDG